MGQAEQPLPISDGPRWEAGRIFCGKSWDRQVSGLNFELCDFVYSPSEVLKLGEPIFEDPEEWTPQ
jgi:hypothetical protein